MNKMKKIVFLLAAPFNQRDYSRFGIETLKTNGFDVEVWDLTPVLNPKIEELILFPVAIVYNKCLKFNTKKDIILAIDKLKNTFVINFCHYDVTTLFIYKRLSYKRIPYACLAPNSFPSYESKRSRSWFINKIKGLTPTKLYNWVLLKISVHLGLRPADFILAGGEKSILYRYPASKYSNIIWTHSFDYDIYLDNKIENIKTEMKTAIFLDQYLPFHPDSVFENLGLPCTSAKYYPALCELFDYVEAECELEVIIAAHPRSNYEVMPDYFGGRKVIKGRTMELVQEADFVMTHYSTAINFAILFRKPIIFITTNELHNSYLGKFVTIFGALFKKEVLNIDNTENTSLEKQLVVDEKIYEKYINDYIKKAGSDEKKLWQIVAEKIKEYEY